MVLLISQVVEWYHSVKHLAELQINWSNCDAGSNPVLTTSDWLLLYNEHRRRKEVEFSQVAELVDDSHQHT